MILLIIACLHTFIYFSYEASHDRSDAQPVPIIHPDDNTWLRCWNQSVSETDILKNIFAEYTKLARPRLNASDPVAVTIAFRLSGITDFVERNNLLIINGYLTLGWIDEFLRWNATWPLSCIDTIYVPSDAVWLPDVALVNSQLDAYAVLTIPSFRVRIYSDGSVFHTPNAQFQVFCDLDLYYFPFDMQSCHLAFRNWNIPSDFQHFHLYGSQPIKTADWVDNHLWQLVATGANVSTEPKWEEVTFTVIISRRPLFYHVTFIIPSIIIAIVELSTFAIPLHEVIKLHISITCLLAYSVFQTSVQNDLPKSSESTPLLCSYINSQSAFIALATLSEALVLFILDRKHSDVVPSILWKTCRLLGPLLFVPYCQEEANESNIENSRGKQLSDDVPGHALKLNFIGQSLASFTHSMVSIFPIPEKNLVKVEPLNTDPITSLSQEGWKTKWLYVAKVLDKCTLCVYISATIVTPVVMFAILPKLQKVGPNSV